jgi:hypothetical protein
MMTQLSVEIKSFVTAKGVDIGQSSGPTGGSHGFEGDTNGDYDPNKSLDPSYNPKIFFT